MKRSEKAAKEALRQHPNIIAQDCVSVVTRKGTHIEYNQGQAVKQGFGSGALFDLFKSKKKNS